MLRQDLTFYLAALGLAVIVILTVWTQRDFLFLRGLAALHELLR
jgi:hypothetical protein